MVCDRRFFLAALAVLPALSAARADDAAEAVAAVQQLQDSQLEIIPKIGQMSVKQRYDALRPPIGATFDLPDIARIVYGAGWGSLTDAQKAEWTGALADYIAASYAAHLEGFNGKGFERDDKTVARDGAQIVTSRVILTKGPPMALDYVVRRTPKGWKIGDILAEGSISELAQWRRSLRGLSQSGFAGAVATLRQRTESLLTP
ncbi:ABC transporter substrate-binding protein [Rhodoblastus acidophilus]|uniref:ABC transporter substrate-binding protein n=1 Tax=Candidatus Rhodoblastus alkanivorans TaxID=2954117 RepID=A0ABS9ZAU5_9HYPH|nr:ABC transporter substrate-binding protein [Candidatus Rhodoblastus alkanivorans]MCI4678895.1 ABC transporter substrate-binding protein [Candidatus Rhodoblastus alkanivorans]MCI4684181.1 ABC transporter substrate-binding protein [Candidatus Rhodoblastus alkanivorans]MDI4641502.1 ABC transporter substrate-binding protein [Rhodoblastus acidophilus]